MFEKSLWVFHLNSGSCNGCDIEVLNIFTPKQDVERLGIKLVGSPRHADAIAFTGPVTRECLPKVIEAFKAVPEPKIVLAIGSCACGGGIWYDTYAVIGGVKELYKILQEEYGIEPPTTIYIPGCPPKPEAIIYAVGVARGLVKQKQKKEIYIEELDEKTTDTIEVLFEEARETRHFLPQIIVKTSEESKNES
ncbi:NADH:ubiquinone oxidoreductase [Thermococcus sp. MV5]|uniref:NADH-quinone oxidoreductase subunit B family protein n=1 Tax=Thermococcus sp. MV5 TaxID=1638272 RepID=UPI00143BAC66|nr:NADH:ubiquinone oxidoreductase [Thermococcus sp. MV5]NJE26968.1 NADH:ubiquinone oxidoreductase [Thermococcus sp. MV5]